MDIHLLKEKNKIIKNYKTLSPEKVLVFWFLLFISILCFFSALVMFNKRFLISTPTYGGAIQEGIIGTPRFINPILASTDQDKDLTSIVFAGLTKKTIDNGIILDLAESIEESEDGLKYKIKLKEAIYFHDGKKITSEDVAFTIDKIQNPVIKSPHKVEWEGVTIEIIDEDEFYFILKKPFPLFMETLSIGIIPKHIWKNLNDDQFSLSDFNIKAIGSGPYIIKEVISESGIPKEFKLTAYQNYSLGRPYIEKIDIFTYQNEKYLLKDFQEGVIKRVHGISPETVTTLKISSSSIESSLLPRTFAIFFNPNKVNILAERDVRNALQLAINKEKIVNDVFYGYGKTLGGPYPFDLDNQKSEHSPENAQEILLKNKKIKENASSTLEITLTTANTDEMRKVAEMIKDDWAKIGIQTSIKIYDVSDLNQTIIKERDFEVLLFGAITQSPSDLYAFWHSSQRTYPGLNISNYVSKTLDKNLEILRESKILEERELAYREVVAEFKEEVPGIFLFAPSLIYITNDKNISYLPKFSYDQSSRFSFIEKWHRYTENVWPKTYRKDVVEFIQNVFH
jgi:peptide/nickel transport system substrate-binding protein